MLGPRLLRVLLLAYPPSLRRAHGVEISAAITDHWQAQPSWSSRLRFIADLFVDFISTWPRAWRRDHPTRHDDHRSEFRLMRTLSSDVRDASRLFRRSPIFGIGTVITLALGIGTSTAIFSLADATLLRPLPIPNASRVIQSSFAWSYPDFQDVAEQQTTFASVAAWAYPPLGIEHDGGTLPLDGAGVSADYFTLTGQHAVIGRLLSAADDHTAGAPTAVLSERLWRRVFNADPAIVGSILIVNKRPVTVVGIVPATFRGLSLQIAPEIFVPLRALPDMATGFLASPTLLTSRSRVWLNWAGRLKPGVTSSLADQQARQIYFRQRPTADARSIADPTPWFTSITDRAIGASLRPQAAGGSSTAADLRRFIWILIGATSVTLLLTCATVANLLLVRAERRRHEFSVRGALGAGRARLARLLLVESLGIGIAGGLAGSGVAIFTLRLLETFALPGQVSIADLHVTMNAGMLAGSAGLGLLTAVLFGMSPVWQLRRLDVAEALRTGSRSTARQPVRALLVGVQVALCVLLLGGSLAFGRAVRYALALDLGFNTTDTTIVTINPTLARYPVARVHAFQQQALDRLRAQPRMRAAAWAAVRPMSGAIVAPPIIDGYTPATGEDMSVQENIVSDGYFDAMEIPIAAGRAFTEHDTTSTPGVTIVSASMAKRYWPVGGAVGGRLSLEDAGAKDPKWITVIGVAGDIHRAIGEPAPLLMYLPARQSSAPFTLDYLIVRTANSPADAASDLRATLHNIDAAMPITRVTTMQSHVGATLMAHRLGLTLFLLFASLSLLLTGLGLYAVVSAAVAQRTREFGIRVALGAETSAVLRLVLRQGIVPITGGLAIGLAAFGASARLIRQFMFSLPVTSPSVLVALTLVIGALASIAMLVPARRALAINPTVTLKAE